MKTKTSTKQPANAHSSKNGANFSVKQNTAKAMEGTASMTPAKRSKTS